MTRASLVFVVFAACHNTPATPPATPAPDPHAAIVDSLVGVWTGNAIGTPFGDFPFALAFDRTPSGAVHGRLDGTPGMYLDFTFDRAKLVEEGAIPSLGKQTHTLAATTGSHWADSTLDVDVAVTAESLVMTTLVRGKPHAVFRMQRQIGARAAKVREAIAARAHSE
jgi:hypothetical protein